MIILEIDLGTLDEWLENLPDIFSSIFDLFFLFLTNIFSSFVEKMFSFLSFMSDKFSFIGKMFISFLDSFVYDYTSLSGDFIYFFIGLLLVVFFLKLIFW